ncbi:MAG TPA: ROK family protein [Steroidobacteraceae bacterium]|jgi:fructokinase|nr:ROK family protein [Steroidobacteraceae bacterium]
MLRSVTAKPLFGAIEAGGTKFVCAAGHGPTEIPDDCRTVIPTTDPATTLAAVVEFFEGVTRRHGALTGIGVAAFGPVDLDTRSPTWGRILATPKPGWSDVSLAAPFERFGCPIIVDTDVGAAALAEARLGAGAGLGSLAYVTVGTGIGGGVFLADRTLKGLLHPEMGHIRVKRDPRDAHFAGVCPFHGDCLEGLASGPAVVARWNMRADRLPETHPAREVLGDYLGQLAATVALMISCERIVFGGGVVSGGRLLPYIRQSASRWLGGYLPIEARAGGFERYITAPGLGDFAGAIGAILLAMQH